VGDDAEGRQARGLGESAEGGQLMEVGSEVGEGDGGVGGAA
jgi:hypothetical protein